MHLNICKRARLVAIIALAPLGCSSSSRNDAGAPSRCNDSRCTAAPPVSDAGRRSSKASPSNDPGLGNDETPSNDPSPSDDKTPSNDPSPSNDTGAPPPTCVSGPGVTTLYEGAVTAFAVGRDRVAIVADSLVSVPLAGGAPMVLATPYAPEDLFAIGSTAYYQDLIPSMGDRRGGISLMAVPLTGGAARVFLPDLPLFAESPGASDGRSYYFTPIRTVGDVGGLSKLTPPSTTIEALTTERLLAASITPYGDYVYFMGTDVSATSGFIGRVPKRGGAVEHLVSDIGVPATRLAVDDSGLYWIQALSRWADGIHRGATFVVLHAGLDGSSIEQILADGPNSIAAAHGRLYFTTSREVRSIAATGGPITTVADSQHAPARLTIAGGNLVWANGIDLWPDAGIPSDVDGSVPAYDASTWGGGLQPTRIMTACIPE